MPLRPSLDRRCARLLALATCSALGGCLLSQSSEPMPDADPAPLRPCQLLSDCEAGESCIAQRCVPPSVHANRVQPPQSSPPIVLVATPAPQLATMLRLTGDERHVGLPVVRWLGDHWLVVWQSTSAESYRNAAGYDGYDGPRLEAVSVWPDGRLTDRLQREQSAAEAGIASDLTITEDGRIGVLAARSGVCSFEVLDAALAGVSLARPIECSPSSQDSAIAAIPGSDEWLVAYGEGEPDGRYLVGRYRPAVGLWTSAQVVLGRSEPFAALDVFSVGSDAVVVRANATGSAITAIPGLAAPLPPVERRVPLPAHPLPLGVAGDGHAFALVQNDARALAFALDGNALWSVAFDASGGEPVLHIVAASGVQDSRPGASFAPELGATGVSFAIGMRMAIGSSDRRHGVSFALVAGNGAPLGSPLVIAHDLLASGGSACAWSGHEFLVVWWELSAGADQAPTEALQATIIRPL